MKALVLKIHIFLYVIVTCPQPVLPNTASFECVNHEGDTVDCSLAVTGTILKFTCSPGYTTPAGISNLKSCRNGNWGTPNQGCSVGVSTEPSFVSISTPPPNDADGIKIVCAYASWASYKGINPDQLDPGLCTHIFYAYGGIMESGDLRVNDDNLDVNQGTHQDLIIFVLIFNLIIYNRVFFNFQAYTRT